MSCVGLQHRIDDIGDFFTNAPRPDVMESLRWAISTLAANTNHTYINIPKRGRGVGLRHTCRLYSDAPSDSGWRTLKTRRASEIQTSVEPLSRWMYHTLALEDLPFVVAKDWQYLWFNVFGRLHKFISGFGQGSPVSNGAADLFAGVCEHRWLHGLSLQLRANLRLNACLVRWMDDRYFLWRPGLPSDLLSAILDPNFYSPACKLKLSPGTSLLDYAWWSGKETSAAYHGQLILTHSCVVVMVVRLDFYHGSALEAGAHRCEDLWGMSQGPWITALVMRFS